MAIFKHGRGFELGTFVNKSSYRSERDRNSGPPNYRSSALTTSRPRCATKRITSDYNRKLTINLETNRTATVQAMANKYSIFTSNICQVIIESA